MEKLDKVEVIREKCGVSYEDAKAALDACDDNVLDAIIWLERQGKSTKQSANYTTESAAQSEVSPEMQAAQQQDLFRIVENPVLYFGWTQ